MKKGVKTVFFGPFVGEFGWELQSWHGWVKRLCRERYADYYKIACSFPGRYPLYPDVDEFWPLPQNFLKNRLSSHGFIADCWIKGFPIPDSKPFELPEVMPLINNVIRGFKKKLPKNTKFIIPWELKYDKEDKKHYGVSIPPNPTSNRDFVTYEIPSSSQILEELQPTPNGLKLLNRMVDPKKQLISIFPRHRLFSRPDKTWPKERYVTLICALQQEFPRFRIAILGEPGGAFFEEGVPKDCIDVIQISPKYRLDVQIAALKRSVLAIGGLSGAIYLALAAGCGALTWGETGAEPRTQRANYTGAKLIFYPSKTPHPDTVLKYARWMLGSGKKPYGHEIKRHVLPPFYYSLPSFIRTSKPLAKIKKSLKLDF